MRLVELRSAQGMLGILCAGLLVGVLVMLADVQDAVTHTSPGDQSITQTITVAGEPKAIKTARRIGEDEDVWMDRHDRAVAKARARGR